MTIARSPPIDTMFVLVTHLLFWQLRCLRHQSTTHVSTTLQHMPAGSVRIDAAHPGRMRRWRRLIVGRHRLDEQHRWFLLDQRRRWLLLDERRRWLLLDDQPDAA